MSEVLSFPAERAVVRSQGLGYEIDRFPVALTVVDHAYVARRHFTPAGYDEADLQPAAADDVGRGVLLCDAHGIEYRVLKRLPRQGLTARTSTNLRGF